MPLVGSPFNAGGKVMRDRLVTLANEAMAKARTRR